MKKRSHCKFVETNSVSAENGKQKASAASKKKNKLTAI